MRVALAIVALAGCDTVFGLERTPDAPPPPSSWTTADGGQLHTCAIRLDHTLWCWGRNQEGELGSVQNGSDLESDHPRQVGTDADWDKLSTTAYTTCAIKLDRSLYCWGYNANGQVGNGTTAGTVADPFRIAGEWTAVATNEQHTCAINLAGAMLCWGLNRWGQLGDGTGDDRHSPTPVKGTTRWTGVGVGVYSTCGLSMDQTIWCWGLNDFGQVGIGDPGIGPFLDPAQLDGTTYSALSVGAQFACGLRTDGRLRCWGNNRFGQIGDGSTTPARTPIAVQQDLHDDWTAVVAGAEHACGLRAGGMVECWGSNEQSQLLSDDSYAFRSVPQPIDDTHRWTTLAAGDHSTCAIDSVGHLACGGYGPAGARGDGTGTPTSPIEIAGAWTNASAGQLLTCGLATNTVSCWGNGSAGAIGDGMYVSRLRPTPVPGAFIDVAASAHVCARQQGTAALFCWGQNHNGQVGQADAGNHPSPIQVLGPAAWSQVSVGPYHTCGVTTAADLYCWGLNENGQAGKPSNTPANVIAPTTKIAGSITVAQAGEFHSCAITTSGAVECWGYPGDGQQGHPGAIQTETPQAVTLPGGTYVGLTSSWRHNCVRAGSSGWCWGLNDRGQVGDQTTTNAPVPVALPRQWRELSAGTEHTCGIGMDGSLWCWGANEFGQLGVGTFVDHHDPVRVGGDTDWESVTAGYLHTCGIRAGGKLFCWGSDLSGEIGDAKAWTVTLAPVVD